MRKGPEDGRSLKFPQKDLGGWRQGAMEARRGGWVGTCSAAVPSRPQESREAPWWAQLVGGSRAHSGEAIKNGEKCLWAGSFWGECRGKG